jgi:hypothetical protein
MRTRQFSIADLVCLLVCGFVVLSIALVGVQRQRAAARGITCSNNLKQLGLALHNYHSAYKQLPMGSGGSSAAAGAELWQNNQDRLSAWVGLTPFAEQQALWEEISNPKRVGAITFPPMGPAPWYDPDVYTPWNKRPGLFVCPLDKDAAQFTTVSSYTLNYGDAIHMVGSPHEATSGLKAQAIRATNRGMFYGKQVVKFRDCLDGLANTLMFSEACIANQPVAKNVAGLPANPSLCVAASKDKATQFWDDGRAACWADGCLRSVGFQTILPPNSPSCTSQASDLEGVMSASSYHAGGVHVCFADGAVLFVLDSIDAGNSDSPTVAIMGDGNKYARPGSQSPYGLWGALGTRAMAETIDREDPNIIPPPRELSEFEIERLQDQPLETWTAANGTSTLKARQVEVQGETAVILLTEQNEVRRVLLSSLRGEDAYRAVERHLAEKMKARKELKTQLENGLKLLDNKQFEQFAVAFVPGADADPKSMAKFVELERGLLIHRFESVIRALEIPNNPGIRFRDDDSGAVAVQVAEINRPMLSRLNLIYQQGRWQLSPR